MAKVRLSSGFHPGTEVKLVRRRANEHHVAGGVIATGTVDDESVLEIDNLDAGEYWAVTEDQGTVQVHAKGDGESDRGEPTEFIDGPHDEKVIVSPPPATEVMLDSDSGERAVARQSSGEVIEAELTGVDPGNDDDDSDTEASPPPARDERVVSGPRTTASARPKRAARPTR